MAIEEVVAGQVFKGRRTILRAGSASQVFARSRTASEGKDAGHRPEDGGNVGHAFKTHLPHKSSKSGPDRRRAAGRLVLQAGRCASQMSY